MELISILSTLNRCHGPAGDEKSVAAAIQELAAPYAHEITKDTMGNLIVHREGTGPKIMIAAHMDSIGLIVTHIEENGWLRFGKLGGLHAISLLHTPIRFRNGTKGVIVASEEADENKLTLDDLYLDIGAVNQDEAQKLVQIGDTAVFDGRIIQINDRLIGPYMDNRISCAALLMVLSRITSHKSDLYFVFTTQEELGLRGAKTAAYSIVPDMALAVDVTVSDDVMGAKHRGSSVLGGGAAIKVMDGSVICHPEMVEDLVSKALTSKIAFQKDIIKAGGTDAGAIHSSRSGVPTGGISIPCRYIHSPVEMVDLSDVKATIELLSTFVQGD